MWHHTMVLLSPFVVILLLYAYGHYSSPTCFLTLSAGHLNISNDVEKIWIIFILCTKNQTFKNRKIWSGLREICLGHFLISTRVGKTNGKDMLN